MFRRVCWLAAAALVACLSADTDCQPHAPCYTEQSITSSASGTPGALAPNTLATIYGTNLSFVERAISADDIQTGELPEVLPGTGVHVFVAGLPGHIYYVSPVQVNFLVPCNLRATEVPIQLVRDGTAGPTVWLQLREASPALFQLDAEHVVASMLDYSVITAEAPAHPGQWVILWATGLGPVLPPATYGMIPLQAARIQKIEDFHVFLDGLAVAETLIGYAGVAPGWAGLYQINLRLPEGVGDNPEIRIAVGEEISPPALRLFVSRAVP
jgi:uncharacterized protein (TIGR03437 family)